MSRPRGYAKRDMTGNAPNHVKLLLQVFLPFAFAYFLSYIFRGVNAVIFPYSSATSASPPPISGC